jgi:glycosyltransferase involved in cell wall biosynthesis
VHSLNPAGGGVAEAIRQFGSAAQAHGCDLTVVTLDEPSDPWLDGLPFKVLALGPRRNGYGYTPTLGPWLRANAPSFDAAIIDGLWQYHGWATYRAFKGEIPYYVMPHGMLDPWFKKQYPFKHLKKWLYWPWAEYRILRDAEGIIFTAEEERRKARQSFWLYRTKHESIAPLGIQEPTYDSTGGQASFQQAVPALGQAPYLLFMGRLHEKKGVDLLIRAYRRLIASCNEAPFQLVLAGPARDAAYQAKLDAVASDCPGIHFAGILHGDAKWAALAGAEALILPSHQENFGLVVVEALAVNTPVLLSNKVDIWREIIDAAAGWVEDDTEEGALSLLRRQCAATLHEKQSMRHWAKQCFDNHYRLEGSVQHLVSVVTKSVRENSTVEGNLAK